MNDSLAHYVETPPVPAPTAALDADALRAEVERRTWFHTIPLPHGIVTHGWREADAWSMYHLPDSLDGQRVLDIGAWEGQFSFEAERRGARSVVALDRWNAPDAGSGGYGSDNFDFAHSALNSKVRKVTGDIYHLADALGETIAGFDVILCLQVLYHLQHPILGLEQLRRFCPHGSVYLETWCDAEWLHEPAMIFYPGAELANDPTNWWGPNILCVQSMAASVGFTHADVTWQRQDVHFGGRGKRVCFHLY